MTARDAVSAPLVVVIEGVEPRGERGGNGLRDNVDFDLVSPYLRLVAMVLALLILAWVAGTMSLQDTVLFSVFSMAVASVLILLPALVRRMGEQPEGRAAPSSLAPDLASSSISSERLDVARAGRSGFDVDDRLRPRLRRDLAVILSVRHGLDIDRADHASRIVDIIGADAWEVVRVDRMRRPVDAGLQSSELNRVLDGCLRAADGGGGSQQ